MRFSYSLPHVIISWLIISIKRTLVHPSTFSAIHHAFAGSVNFSSIFISISPLPSFFSINSPASKWYLAISQHLVCIPLLLLVISFLNSLSCFLFLTLLFEPLCLAHSVRESHISAMREIKFAQLPQWFCHVLLDTERVLITQLKALGYHWFIYVGFVSLSLQER